MGVSRGRSRCPHCLATITWRDNIPVLSWLLLGGRCRACKGAIPVFYPAGELIVAIGFGLAALTFDGPAAFAAAALFWALHVSFWIDYDHRIIPNEITFPFTIIGLLFAPFLHLGRADLLVGFLQHLLGLDLESSPFLSAFLGAIVGALAIACIRALGQWFYKQEAMGLGDLKFLAMIGAWLGPAAALKALLLGAIIGGIVALGMLMLKKANRRSYIPFGPFLALGAVWVLFAEIGAGW
jgi:leader peptidase (prepilin peptidase)/N-methyltransferase